jgi:hypothetical protein
MMRSRLEARWAAFFDAVGLPWEYEPIRLDGWVPDFRLVVPCPTVTCPAETHTLLVEIKPFTSQQEFGYHPSNKYRCGTGIEEDGIGHFGLDWRTCWTYLRHATGTRVSRILKTTLAPLCPSEKEQNWSDLPRWLADKWSEACSTIRQIATEAEGPADDLLQSDFDGQPDKADPFDVAEFVIMSMNSVMEPLAARGKDITDYRQAVCFALLDLDKKYSKLIPESKRAVILDVFHHFQGLCK